LARITVQGWHLPEIIIMLLASFLQYKLFWYVHEALLEDPEVQENGVVYLTGNPRRKSSLADQDRKLDSRCASYIRKSLPVRIVAIHHYESSRLIEYVVPLALAMLGSYLQVRYQLHVGEEDNYLEELEGYGIARKCLPQDIGGISSFDYSEWLIQRRVASL
jgi:hypothetical protein